MHAVAEAVVEIGIQVAVVGRGQPVAAGDDTLQGPAARTQASRGFGRPVVDGAAVGAEADPALGERDPRIGMDRVVAEEVQRHEDRHRPLRLGREHEEQIQGRTVLAGGVETDLAADGRPPEHRRLAPQPGGQRAPDGRRPSVDLTLEGLQGPGAPVRPGWQRVARHPGLVEVGEQQHSAHEREKAEPLAASLGREREAQAEPHHEHRDPCNAPHHPGRLDRRNSFGYRHLR